MADQPEGSTGRGRRSFVAQVSRKVRACDECRRHKIRCDLKGPDDGLPCGRCARMKLECKLTKSLQSILEQRNVDEDWRQSVEERLGVALRAIDELQRSHDADAPPHKRLRTESENPLGMLADAASDGHRVTWNDDVEDAGADPASAPGQYLSHISERSQFATKPARQRNSADIVDRGLVSLNDAKTLFELYIAKLDPHVYSIVGQAHVQVDPQARFDSVRRQPLLFLAVCTVAALHQSKDAYRKDRLFSVLHDEFVRLSAQQSVIRDQSLDDIRALLVASWWLRDLSWISTGSAVRLATERGMQEAYKRCSDMNAGRRACRSKGAAGLHVCGPGEAVRQDVTSVSTAAEREAYEASKLYYLVYVADHQAAIPFARPPMTRQHAAVRNVRAWLAGCRLATNEDARLAAQVELWVIAHDVVDDFGIDVQQALTRLQVTEQVPRFLTLVDRWQARWKHVLDLPAASAALTDEIDFHAHMMRLFVAAHIFRSPRGVDPLSINVNDDEDAKADWAYDDVEQRLSFAQRSLPQLPPATSLQTKDQQAYRYELGRRAVSTAIELIQAATMNRHQGTRKAVIMFGQPIYPFSMVVFACLFLHKLSRRKGRTSDQHGRITLPDCSTSATMQRIQSVVDMLRSRVIPLCAQEHISATVLPGLLSLLAVEKARLEGEGVFNEQDVPSAVADADQNGVNIDELLTLPSSTFDGVTMTGMGSSPNTPTFNFDLQSLDLLSDLRYLSGISSDVLFWQMPQDNVQFAG